MLGEKRNLSLFGSQPAQEEKQVKHITVDRDGEKKDIPLYFGPDWPVVNGTGDTVPSPSDDPSACQAEATAEKTEETIPVEPIPQMCGIPMILHAEYWPALLWWPTVHMHFSLHRRATAGTSTVFSRKCRSISPANIPP